MESWRNMAVIVIPDLIRDPFRQRRINGSRIKSGMTKQGHRPKFARERAI
jgi:hypothetical protein